MDLKKMFYSVSLLVAFSFFVPCQGWTQMHPYAGEMQPKPGGHAPIITHAFATESGYYGYVWKIYIEAEDLDGDMLSIACSVDQVGYGHYPTDLIYLKPKYQKHFKGYIQWNTFSSKAPYLREGTQITLRVSIVDRAKNASNQVVLPFIFQHGRKSPYQYQLPAPFDQGDIPKLGNIHIDLFEPTQMGGDGSGSN